MLLPYQDKTLAKEIAVKTLTDTGFPVAAKAVKEAPVYLRKLAQSPITSAEKAYAKKWDKKLVREEINHAREE